MFIASQNALIRRQFLPGRDRAARLRSCENHRNPAQFQWHEDCVINVDMSFEYEPTPSLRAGIRAALEARRSPSLHDIAGRYDIHAMTPREMADLSAELYMAGFLNHEQ